MKFAMFFMAEYMNMIVGSAVTVTLFLGGWHFFGLENMGGPVWSGLISLRYFLRQNGDFPIHVYLGPLGHSHVFRYDQLMNFGWKFLLPVALTSIVVTGTLWIMTGSRLVVGIGNVIAAFIVVSIVASLLAMQAPQTCNASPRFSTFTQHPGCNRVGGIRMNPEQILFVIFGAISLIGAIAVISFRHPIYSALSLIITFFAQAGLFVLLGAHFVCRQHQVIVYAGAIMVLFLFVIMLLNLGTLSVKGALGGKLKGFAIILGILFAAEGIYIAVNALNDTALASAAPVTGVVTTTTYDIGELLFTKYLLPFEVTSLILLAALIGVIVLVKREPQNEN